MALPEQTTKGTRTKITVTGVVAAGLREVTVVTMDAVVGAVALTRGQSAVVVDAVASPKPRVRVETGAAAAAATEASPKAALASLRMVEIVEARPVARPAEDGDGARVVVVAKNLAMAVAAVVAAVVSVVVAAAAAVTVQEVEAAVRIVVRKSRNVR